MRKRSSSSVSPEKTESPGHVTIDITNDAKEHIAVKAEVPKLKKPSSSMDSIKNSHVTKTSTDSFQLKTHISENEKKEKNMKRF